MLGKVLRIIRTESIPSDNPFFATATGNNRAICARSQKPVHVRHTRTTGRMFSTTSDRAPGRRSTTASPVRTMAGPPPKGDERSAFPRAALLVRPRHRADHRLLESTAERSTSRRHSVSRPPTWASTSLPTTAAAGFAFSIRRRGRLRTSHRHREPVDVKVGPDGALYFLGRGGGGQVGRIRFTG